MTEPAVLVACHHCQAINRIPADRLSGDPVCGKCGAQLLEGKPVTLDDSNFARVTSRTELPVLVDFWATWCGPCIQMAPQFDEAARRLKGKAMLVKVAATRASRRPRGSASAASRRWSSSIAATKWRGSRARPVHSRSSRFRLPDDGLPEYP